MDHIGRVQTVEALGRQWKLARWDRSVWATICEQAKTLAKDPRVEATEWLAMLPKGSDHAEMIVKEALAARVNWCGIGSPLVTSFVNSLEGTVFVVKTLLQAHHPLVTDDEAYELVMSVGTERMTEVLKRCSGVIEGKGLSRGEPKPETEAATASPGQQSTEA